MSHTQCTHLGGGLDRSRQILLIRPPSRHRVQRQAIRLLCLTELKATLNGLTSNEHASGRVWITLVDFAKFDSCPPWWYSSILRSRDPRNRSSFRCSAAG